jgi:uncharacterized protein
VVDHGCNGQGLPEKPLSGSIGEIALLLGGGLLAGSLGGFLGIGGGIVLMPLLRFGIGLEPAYAAGTCVVAVFFTTLGGGVRHLKSGHLKIRSVVPVIIAGVVASGLSSMLFGYFSGRGQWLDLGVGLVFSLISLRMIAEGIFGFTGRARARTTGNEVRGGLLQKTGVGVAAGVLPGLLGIGTGGILVPAFNFLLDTPIKTAMAASLVCFSFNALVSSAFKIAQGFVDPLAAIPVCLGTLTGAYLGAILNRRFSSGLVKLFFGLVFTVVSIRFIISSTG